jgi:hypothetical protein
MTGLAMNAQFVSHFVCIAHFITVGMLMLLCFGQQERLFRGRGYAIGDT